MASKAIALAAVSQERNLRLAIAAQQLARHRSGQLAHGQTCLVRVGEALLTLIKELFLGVYINQFNEFL
jgi:hypothetical protein